MEELSTDCPLSRSIVISFLDFLKSVKPAPGVDVEGLEVAKECLMEVFKLNQSSLDQWNSPGSLVNIFQSWKTDQFRDVHPDSSQEADLADIPGPSHTFTGVSYSQDQESRETCTSETSKDELLQQFFTSLEKINFFESGFGENEESRLDKATFIFNNAILEMERSECHKFHKNTLADILKSQGNQAMQSKLYADAINLYTFAIAVCEDNAVYYCNRGAAYTQIQRYDDAINDCEKAIEIDPNYSKAYNRLGTAYYAQGKYTDAVQKGFRKAMELDPTNETNKENYRVAQAKQFEEMLQNAIPTSDVDQDPPPQPSMENRGFEEPEIGLNGNVTFTMNGPMPDQIGVPLRSFIEMLSAAAAQGSSNG